MDLLPNDIESNFGYTEDSQRDLNILFFGDEPKHMVLINIPYSDHTGKEKFVVGAVYNVVHEIIPPRLPTLLPPPKTPAYEIRDVPGRGKGLIATRNIAFGEIVLVERPILISPHAMDLRDMDEFRKYARQTINPDVWNKFNGLMNVKPDYGKEKYTGVFLELSYVNHSCGPNLTRSWDPDLFVLCAQAVRDIPAGRELTITYQDPCGYSNAERRFNLELTYKFKCACEHCMNEHPMSDAVRSEQQEDIVSVYLEHWFNKLIDPSQPHRKGRANMKMFKDSLTQNLIMVTMEGIECIPAMWYYMYLMKVSGILGDKEKFKEWGFKAVLASMRYVQEQGEKARRDVEQWVDWVREPETFPGWARFR